MLDTILEKKEKEKKNRKILDTLNYRGKKAVKGLHDAFLDTENQELAELLAEYVKVHDDNRFSPSVWPPLLDEQKRMESEPVRRIKDIKSPLVAHEYTSSEVYKMRNKTRGMVFMINNLNFTKQAPVYLTRREGSDIDAHNLRKLFVGLQFKVVEKEDQAGQEMLKFLEEQKDRVNWTEMECMILIINSHGCTYGIYGSDGVIVPLNKMTDIFKECPGLNEKPKLVFVQACPGTNTETDKTEGLGGIQATEGHGGIQATEGHGGIQATEGHGENQATEGHGGIQATEDHGGIQATDGMKQLTLKSKDETDALKSYWELPMKTVHSEADFLIAYATPAGTPAYRNIEVGSWFLNAIVWTFKYHADQLEIQHLLLKVNRLVSQGRTSRGNLTVSEISNKLRKKFFFFPGIYNDPPELLKE